MILLKLIEKISPVIFKWLGIYVTSGSTFFEALITFIGTKVGHSVCSVYLLYLITLFNKKFIEWVFYIDPLWKHIRFFYLIEYYILHSIIVIEFCFVFDLLITGGQCTEFLLSLSWMDYINSFFNSNVKKTIEGNDIPPQNIVQSNPDENEGLVAVEEKAPYSIKGVLLFTLSILIYFF